MSSPSGASEELKPLNLPEKQEYTHRAHRFPGKFHPPLIAHILEEFGEEHDVIADPMCGSGTAGIEAAVAGKDSVLVDIDPLSALISRGKSHPVDPDLLRETGEKILKGAEEFPKEGQFGEEEARAEVEANVEGKQYTIPYNLFHWFEPYVAVGYSRLLDSAHCVLKNESEEMADAIHTVLAASVRRISRADPQPVSGLEVTSVRKEELEKGIDFDVEETFQQVLNRLASGYEELLKVDELGDVDVLEGDSRGFSALIEESEYDPTMVILSPPYCNAIEYSRRHRLEYEWLGLFNGEEVKNPRTERIESSREFIGSVTPRQDTLKNLPEVPHDTVRELMANIEEENERKANLLRKYFLDSYEWIEEIHDTLPKGGRFCLIIGPSTSYGHTVNTPEYLEDIALDQGFEVEHKQSYLLKNNKMQYPTNGETTETETLFVFEA